MTVRRSVIPFFVSIAAAGETNLTIRDYYVASRWNRPGTANVVELEAVVPFKVWGQRNLMRVSIPFRTLSDLGPGLSDSRIFDLLVFGSRETMWGVGPAINLGVGRIPGIGAFQAGPAAVFVSGMSGSLIYGALNQNFFGDGVSVSTLLPILVFRLADAWTLELGDLPIVYNWKKSQFAVVSIGLEVGVLAKPGGQPLRFFLNPQFNTQSSTELYKWTIAGGVTLALQPPGD